jgi:hypothetical protein
VECTGYTELDDDVGCSKATGGRHELTRHRMWLPGAEAGLRWLRRAHMETRARGWDVYCPVPLGISSFRRHADTGRPSPAMWGSAWWRVDWVKRHEEAAEMAAWEQPEVVVADMRAYFGGLGSGV